MTDKPTAGSAGKSNVKTELDMSDLTILLASDGLTEPVEHIAEHAFKSFFKTDRDTERFTIGLLTSDAEKNLKRTDCYPKRPRK